MKYYTGSLSQPIRQCSILPPDLLIVRTDTKIEHSLCIFKHAFHISDFPGVTVEVKKLYVL